LIVGYDIGTVLRVDAFVGVVSCIEHTLLLASGMIVNRMPEQGKSKSDKETRHDFMSFIFTPRAIRLFTSISVCLFSVLKIGTDIIM